MVRKKKKKKKRKRKKKEKMNEPRECPSQRTVESRQRQHCAASHHSTPECQLHYQQTIPVLKYLDRRPSNRVHVANLDHAPRRKSLAEIGNDGHSSGAHPPNWEWLYEKSAVRLRIQPLKYHPVAKIANHRHWASDHANQQRCKRHELSH